MSRCLAGTGIGWSVARYFSVRGIGLKEPRSVSQTALNVCALTNFVNMALYYLFLDEITFNISFNSLGGKVDLQISVECESAIYYIAKYGTKTEQNSKDLDALTKDFSEKVFKMKAQLKQSFEVPIQKHQVSEKNSSKKLHVCCYLFQWYSYIDIRLNCAIRVVEQ